MKPTHIRRALRLVSLGGALLGLAWIYGRFDLVTLPSKYQFKAQGANAKPKAPAKKKTVKKETTTETE